MTVNELIKALEACPDKEMQVFRDGGQYRDDWRHVTSIKQIPRTSLGQNRGVYIQ